MAKAVLISIRPEWAAKIVTGEKTVEIRKTRPKLKTPFKCYIYETQGKSDTPWIDEDGYAWRISKLEIYDTPKSLSKFTGPRKTKFGAEPMEIKRAPQSWCYVEELKK